MILLLNSNNYYFFILFWPPPPPSLLFVVFFEVVMMHADAEAFFFDINIYFNNTFYDGWWWGHGGMGAKAIIKNKRYHNKIEEIRVSSVLQCLLPASVPEGPKARRPNERRVSLFFILLYLYVLTIYSDYAILVDKQSKRDINIYINREAHPNLF